MTAAPLMDRRDGIGGSDVAAILGIDDRRTPYEVYLEKIGEGTPLDETEPIYWGKVLEDAVAQRYVQDTGRRVQRVNRTLRHREHPWMTAHIDRRVIATGDGVRRLLEVKTTGLRDEWGEHGTSSVPDRVYCQVQHYAAVDNADVVDVAALMARFCLSYAAFEVPRDNEFIRWLIDQEAEFMARVCERRPPDPKTEGDCRRRWAVANGQTTIVLAKEQREQVIELAHVRAQAKLLEDRDVELKLALMMALGDHSAGLATDGKTPLVTWKDHPENRLDVKALIEAEPQIAARFTPQDRRVRPLKLTKAARELAEKRTAPTKTEETQP